MTLRNIGHIICFFLAIPSAGHSQRAPGPIGPGTQVRVMLAGGGDTWLVGRFVSTEGGRLFVERDGETAGYALANVLAVQIHPKSGNPWIGGAIGMGAGFVLATVFGDGAGSSDVAGVMALGAGIGAAWSAGGRRVRFAGGMGLLSGVAVGAIGFGTAGSACESGAGRACSAVVGGALVGALGLLVGTAIGMFLPNWESVSLNDVRGGVFPDGTFSLSWGLGL